eukprot:5721185-Prymnesium_polylepis.1
MRAADSYDSHGAISSDVSYDALSSDDDDDLPLAQRASRLRKQLEPGARTAERGDHALAAAGDTPAAVDPPQAAPEVARPAADPAAADHDAPLSIDAAPAPAAVTLTARPTAAATARANRRHDSPAHCGRLRNVASPRACDGARPPPVGGHVDDT